mmetsp:Transcript_119967/g.334673  ORF Transcript_119967/g.334673 Transcript_119967/m.334673 type:complete len:266 (+) Transcript_119967:11-808(+)
MECGRKHLASNSAVREQRIGREEMLPVLLLVVLFIVVQLVPVHTACANGAWSDDHSPHRCHMVGRTAVVSCDGKRGADCGMRMSSTYHVGVGSHSMIIRAAPGAGVATTFYLSTNEGLYDKFKQQPWNELDFEIMGLQASAQTRIWTNVFTGVAVEHNQMISVPFDVTAGYHNYTFNITESNVAFVVDGVAYRSMDITPFPDLVSAIQCSAFAVFASVWGKSSQDEGEGIPAFRNALGVLDRNPNLFPVFAGFRREPAPQVSFSP